MSKLSRRSFVKQLAGLSMLGAAAPVLSSLAGCDGDRITLNVVLHGLFIMNITNSQIELLTPYVDKHYYGAGSWDKNGITSLCHGRSYELRITDHIGKIRTEKMPPLGPDANLTLSQSQYNFTVHHDKTYFTIVLPFPQGLAFLRRVGDTANQLPAGGTPAIINTFALCPVLIYDVKNCTDLELTGTNWKPYIDKKTRTSNLHLWAEPKKRLSPEHAEEAFKLLSSLVCPVDIRLGVTKSTALDHPPSVEGIAEEEEQGLSEWISGGETSHPTNCNVVITTK